MDGKQKKIDEGLDYQIDPCDGYWGQKEGLNTSYISNYSRKNLNGYVYTSKINRNWTKQDSKHTNTLH